MGADSDVTAAEFELERVSKGLRDRQHREVRYGGHAAYSGQWGWTGGREGGSGGIVYTP